MGLDKISVTLYDLLGYLLPGYVLLLACSVAEASFGGTSLFALARISRSPILAAVVAYFLGQASHGIGAIIKSKKYRWFDDHGRYSLSPDIKERVIAAIKETYGIKLEGEKELSKIDAYLLADNYILASGGSIERDILTAREGFFKAAMVAFVVMAVTMLSTLLSQLPRIQIQPGIFVLPTRLSIVALTIFFLFLCWLFRQRFIFFNRAKNNNALLTFLALRQGAGSKAGNS